MHFGEGTESVPDVNPHLFGYGEFEEEKKNVFRFFLEVRCISNGNILEKNELNYA